MALELGIGLTTFKRWEAEHEEFRAAVKEAVDLAQGWWEREGRRRIFNSVGFNVTGFIFYMTNRFGADWKHKAEQTHEAGDGLASLLRKLTPDVFPGQR